MAILQPTPKSLNEIFRGKKYKVPIYQRAYSWGIEEAEELWDDLSSNPPPYFLGILLLKKNKDKDGDEWFEVVDGQQRLATLMLLLRAAVETLDKDCDQRKDLQKDYINQKEFGQDKSNFTLTLNQRDNDNFKTLLDDNHTYYPPTGTRRSMSSKNLEETKKVFADKFSELASKKGPDGVIAFVRDSILKLTMIDIQLQEDSDVYTFFETLNDRGIDLSLADLIKNRVCSVPHTDPYSAAASIDKITELLGSGNIKSFLLHYCWAISDDDTPPPRNKLMDWYKDTIDDEGDSFLKNLSDYSRLYLEIIEPRKGSSQSKDVLTFLKVLGASRCYPVLLVGLYNLPGKNFNRLCKAVEILTVRHSTIVKRDAKDLEKVYKDIATDIREKVDIEIILNELKDQAKKISDEIFQTNFKVYSTTNTRIARYLLFRIENYLQGEDTVPAEWEKLTLEHILAIKSEGSEEFKERLGNMALLSGKLNSSLSNKPFSSKREEYKKEPKFKLTHDLVDYPDFTHETIQERQIELAKIALKVWDPDKIA